MNQSFIINDDYQYLTEQKVWQCSAMLAGEKIEIMISSFILPSELTQSIKFDWESEIEDWLEDNEPIDGLVTLQLK